MNHADKIMDLQEKERALMFQSIEGAKAGTVPPSLHRELEEIRAELKTARRVRAMDANRTDPKKSSRFSILLPDTELEELTKRAAQKGMVFSSYIRYLLKIGLEVEDKGRPEGKSGE